MTVFDFGFDDAFDSRCGPVFQIDGSFRKNVVEPNRREIDFDRKTTGFIPKRRGNLVASACPRIKIESCFQQIRNSVARRFGVETDNFAVSELFRIKDVALPSFERREKPAIVESVSFREFPRVPAVGRHEEHSPQISAEFRAFTEGVVEITGGKKKSAAMVERKFLVINRVNAAFRTEDRKSVV